MLTSESRPGIMFSCLKPVPGLKAGAPSCLFPLPAAGCSLVDATEVGTSRRSRIQGLSVGVGRIHWFAVKFKLPSHTSPLATLFGCRSGYGQGRRCTWFVRAGRTWGSSRGDCTKNGAEGSTCWGIFDM